MRVNLNRLLHKSPSLLKRTKMVCTIGPASNDVTVLKQLLAEGMNVCRINFSHDDHSIHYNKLLRIREAVASNPLFENTAIMLDTKGPEIRTGKVAGPGKIELKKGRTVLVTSDYAHPGTADKFAVSYEHLARDVKVGSKILLADGNLTLVVKEVLPAQHCVACEVQNDFQLGERKNVNLPGVKVDLPVISEKDRIDLIDFGLKHDVDMIALSFTRSAKCVAMCKDTLGSQGRHIRIIPKIENQEGLENLDEILKVSDGVMIARGDLGMEMEPSKLYLAQQYITETALRHGKPVVMATQMLESMTGNSRPTRAEITDVGAAVAALVDSTMLSGETGNGMFPVESVRIMADICRETEAHMEYQVHHLNDLTHPSFAVARAAVELARVADCKVILVYGDGEKLVQNLSALRPHAIVMYLSSDPRQLRGLNLSFGVFGMKVGVEVTNRESIPMKEVQARLKALYCDSKKMVLVNASKESIECY